MDLREEGRESGKFGFLPELNHYWPPKLNIQEAGCIEAAVDLACDTGPVLDKLKQECHGKEYEVGLRKQHWEASAPFQKAVYKAERESGHSPVSNFFSYNRN